MSDQRAQIGPPPGPSKSKRNSHGWLVWLLVLPVIFGGIGLMTGAVVAYLSPKKYESQAVVQIHPTRIEADSSGWPGVSTGAGRSTQFMATQFAVITAAATMERVVDRLDLSTRWNMTPDEVVDLLQGIVTVEQIRGTDLITIRVRHTHPNDARDIAEAVAASYAARRTEQEIERAEQALNALDAELRAQEDLVEEKRKILDTIVQAIGIAYVDGTAEGNVEKEESFYGNPEPTYAELEREKVQLDIQMEGLSKWTGDELFKYAAGLNLPRNSAAVLYPEYRTELRKLNDLVDSGIGDAHPQLVAQSARVDLLSRELEREIVDIRELLETMSELVDKRLAKVKSVMSERPHWAADRGDGSLVHTAERHDYIEAKREYEEGQQLLQQQNLAHSSQRINLKIPRSPVTIHEEPKVGRAPVSPKVTLMLGGGMLAGGVFGFLLAILIGIVRSFRNRGE